MIDLSGKSAVVTGGSRGIGRAIVLRLATQGADVAFSYRGNAAAADATAAEVRALGRTAIPVAADVSQPESAEALVKSALDSAGQGRHPGQQRGHHAGRPHHAHGHRRVAGGARDQPVRCVLHPQGGHATDAQGAQRADRQHHQRVRAGRPDGPGELLLGQGRSHRADQGGRTRARQPGHHGQRGGAGVRAHGADPGPARRAQGGAHPSGRRWPASARPRRSRTRWRSSPRTRRRTSRGRCWRSTAAS